MKKQFNLDMYIYRRYVKMYYTGKYTRHFFGLRSTMRPMRDVIAVEFLND